MTAQAPPPVALPGSAATRRAFIERLAATTALPAILPILLSHPFPARADY
jgi:hypothetical protein